MKNEIKIQNQKLKGKNEMEFIGKYRGYKCYVCTDKEYNECTDIQPNVIYIIDGTMVKNGLIIGHYDGNTVRDVYDCVPYKVRHTPGPEREMVKTEKKTEEVVADTDIDFSKYSKVVDEFFRLLDMADR